MDDREKTSKLMTDIHAVIKECHLPGVMIIGVLEALKFEVLDITMNEAERDLLTKMIQSLSEQEEK